MPEYSPGKIMSADKYQHISAPNGGYCLYIPQFSRPFVLQKILQIIYTIAFIWCENMPEYSSLDTTCSSKLTVFLELCSQNTVRFLEQIMSADKYPSMFSCQLKAIVYLLYNNQINAHALIGQSAVGYCAGKPMEKSHVF